MGIGGSALSEFRAEGLAINADEPDENAADCADGSAVARGGNTVGSWMIISKRRKRIQIRRKSGTCGRHIALLNEYSSVAL